MSYLTESDWCNSVSDSETYCCGFGGQASCIARGLDYSGPNTPCEVKLVTNNGVTTCEGQSGTSGNLSEGSCDCESGWLFPVASVTF